MKKRIVFGAVMIVVLVGLFYLDWWLGEGAQQAFKHGVDKGKIDPAKVWPIVGIPLSVLMLVLLGMGVFEMACLCAGGGIRLLPISAVLGAALVGTMPFWWQFHSSGAPTGMGVLLVAGLVMIAVFLEQMIRWRTKGAIRSVAGTLLTVAYLGVGAAMMLAMRIGHSLEVLVLYLAVVKFTDIGAYFTGSMIGKHKLIPWLSPGKTWEGLAGGLATAAAVSAAGEALWGTFGFVWWKACVFGAVVGLFGQFADLCESLMKRDAALKDSGVLVPEFGGVLDLVDSPLLAAPVAVLLLQTLR